MSKADKKRHVIADKLADHLLAEGLRGGSLRQLAKAAGTSDRMLLHYFENKDELMNMTLTLIADRFMALLGSAQPEPVSIKPLAAFLSGMVNQPHVRPYLKLWLELAASAAGGTESHREIAKRIFQDYFDWVFRALSVESEKDRIALAALVIAIIEGFVLMDAFDSGDYISKALEGLETL